MRILKVMLVTAALAAASVFMVVPVNAGDKPAAKCPAGGKIEVSKKADRDKYNVGDIVTYTIVVKAVGCPADVNIKDTLPDGLTLDSGSKTRFSADLEAGSEESFTVKAKATKAGSPINEVKVKGESRWGHDTEKEGCRDQDQEDKDRDKDKESDCVCSVTGSARAQITVVGPTPSSSPSPSPSPSPAQPMLPNTGHMA